MLIYSSWITASAYLYWTKVEREVPWKKKNLLFLPTFHRFPLTSAVCSFLLFLTLSYSIMFPTRLLVDYSWPSVRNILLIHLGHHTAIHMTGSSMTGCLVWVQPIILLLLTINWGFYWIVHCLSQFREAKPTSATCMLLAKKGLLAFTIQHA